MKTVKAWFEDHYRFVGVVNGEAYRITGYRGYRADTPALDAVARDAIMLSFIDGTGHQPASAWVGQLPGDLWGLTVGPHDLAGFCDIRTIPGGSAAWLHAHGARGKHLTDEAAVLAAAADPPVFEVTGGDGSRGLTVYPRDRNAGGGGAGADGRIQIVATRPIVADIIIGEVTTQLLNMRRECEKALAFLSGLDLRDHTTAEQRQQRDVVQSLMRALDASRGSR